ncbi:hypothetical protein TIFTF001_030696 [Ficus carica]|uniref:Uncharacterized protein n=1 Tax=Ficus carica TaxID=3494 RepID=A0AA88DTV4_FICCA|nr:hypothetical protein TIFTF001_030696 [Ficus carica]
MITRIEIHLAQEEASRARPNQLYPPINQPPNLLNNIRPRPSNNPIFPNPSFPPPPPRPFFPGPVINIVSCPPNMVPPRVSPPPNLAAQAPQGLVAETRGGDVSRPFLRLLERPTPKVVGSVNLEKENRGDNLDLTLKL